jgi:hypothetical protein
MSPTRSATLARLRTWDREGAGPPVLGKHLGSAAHLVAVLLSEYRRAVAAERRYEELRRTSVLSVAENTRADLSRRVFAEMYSCASYEQRSSS